MNLARKIDAEPYFLSVKYIMYALGWGGSCGEREALDGHELWIFVVSVYGFQIYLYFCIRKCNHIIII